MNGLGMRLEGVHAWNQVFYNRTLNFAIGIPTPGGDPVWKCVCTLSGYHNRDIYDVNW